MNIPCLLRLCIACIGTLLSLSVRPVLAQVVQSVPAPAGAPLSSHYSVVVTQGGQSQNVDVYLTTNPGVASSSKEIDTAWATFATNAPVTVQVTNTCPFVSAAVLPTRAQITPTISGQTVSFSMGGVVPQQVSVEFSYNDSSCDSSQSSVIDHPLLIFANPLESPPPSDALIAQPNQVPPLANRSTIYFTPGLYDFGTTPYAVGPNQTAILPAGTYIKGTFTVGTRSKIQGLGILSGINYPHCPSSPGPCTFMIDGREALAYAVVQGVTIVDSPNYNILLGGGLNTVDNVKVMSWSANTDGVSAGANGMIGGGSITSSFFKTGDDAIKLYSSGLLVAGCTLWQLDNAASFEMGVNLAHNVTDVVVQDSDVIHTEWTYPNRSNAVVSAAFGGNANGSNYTFQDIRVDNPPYQLFKLAVIPNPYTSDNNNSLGSIANITFSNIQIAQTPTLPNLFQSFDRQHQVGNVVFDNVTYGTTAQQQPALTFNANRNFSLGGTVFSSLLLRDPSDPGSFEVALFPAASQNPYPTIPVTNPALTSNITVQAIGDFDGNGSASVLLRDNMRSELDVWQNPLQSGSGYAVIGLILPTEIVAGIGDFNGDGRADILIWDVVAHTGRVMLMNGPHEIGRIPVRPANTSIVWSVAGVGDIQQTGVSDIILRAPDGTVEILSPGAGSFVAAPDLPASAFFYDYSSDYTPPSPPTHKYFDQTWSAAAVGDFEGNGYAGILWLNSTTRELGVTEFKPSGAFSVYSGTVFAQLPANTQLVAFGDYNGDDTKDLMLRSTQTGELTIWYSKFNGGKLYAIGPTFPLTWSQAVQR